MTGAIAHLLVHCPYISLPNLIAGREVMPEHAFVGRPSFHAQAIASQLDTWLSERLALERSKAELAKIKQQVGQTGGVNRAAEAILRRLGQAPVAAALKAA
jgi:lipid-A-disaccharide synthase